MLYLIPMSLLCSANNDVAFKITVGNNLTPSQLESGSNKNYLNNLINSPTPS
jgi:hypothetical protein